MVNKKRSGMSSTISDLLFETLEEGIGVLVDALRNKILNPFPMLMKKISYKLFMKYIWLAVFSLAGLIILGIGIGELIDFYTALNKGVSYVIVGAVFLLIGWLQYKNKINLF